MKRDKDERAKVPERAIKAFEHKPYQTNYGVSEFLDKVGVNTETDIQQKLSEAHVKNYGVKIVRGAVQICESRESEDKDV